MQLRDAFPNTAEALPTLLNWGAAFEWEGGRPAAVAELFTAAMEEAQKVDRELLLETAELIRRDLTAETARVGDGPEAPLVDGFRFLVAIPPIIVTMAMGRHGDCYGWVLGSVSRTHDPSKRSNTADYTLPPYIGAPVGFNRMCLGYLNDWTETAFMVARKFGGMDQFCDQMLDYCAAHAIGGLKGPDISSAVHALISITNWAANRNDPRAEALVQLLHDLYRLPALDPRIKVRLGILFATPAGKWTPQGHKAWAQEVLRDYRPLLVEHEVVQLLSATIGSAAEWNAARQELLVEIRQLANTYRAQANEADATLALEARVWIIHPLIFALTEHGSTEDLMDVLWSWYGREGHKRGSGDILFVGSAHGNGVGYVWPGGRHIVQNNAPAETLEALLEGVSGALNEYFRGPRGDRNVELEERMIGAPAYRQTKSMIDAMDTHYRFDQLTAVLPEGWRPRSIVVLPAHRDPLQARLAEVLGWMAPLEASVAEPETARAIRTLSVWPGETQTTEAEVSYLRALAAEAGWEIKVVEGLLDAAAFRSFYEDPNADLLWVIGHGEQSPFRMEDSGLVLADETLLTPSNFATFTRPADHRRLLVLNICSATATQNRGGLARIGFAHDLATGDQTVLGHLWPIDYYAALAFGCTLATHLMTHDPGEALRRTQADMRSPREMLHRLAEVDEGAEAVARLASERAMKQVENILSWGSAILLT